MGIVRLTMNVKIALKLAGYCAGLLLNNRNIYFLEIYVAYLVVLILVVHVCMCECMCVCVCGYMSKYIVCEMNGSFFTHIL